MDSLHKKQQSQEDVSSYVMWLRHGLNLWGLGLTWAQAHDHFVYLLYLYMFIHSVLHVMFDEMNGYVDETILMLEALETFPCAKKN